MFRGRGGKRTSPETTSFASMETSTLRNTLATVSATIPACVGGVECGRAGCSLTSLLSALPSEAEDEGRLRVMTSSSPTDVEQCRSRTSASSRSIRRSS